MILKKGSRPGQNGFCPHCLSQNILTKFFRKGFLPLSVSLMPSLFSREDAPLPSASSISVACSFLRFVRILHTIRRRFITLEVLHNPAGPLSVRDHGQNAHPLIAFRKAGKMGPEDALDDYPSIGRGNACRDSAGETVSESFRDSGGTDEKIAAGHRPVLDAKLLQLLYMKPFSSDRPIRGVFPGKI